MHAMSKWHNEFLQIEYFCWTLRWIRMTFKNPSQPCWSSSKLLPLFKFSQYLAFDTIFFCARFWTYRIRLRMDFPVTASVLFCYCCCIAFVTFLLCIFAWIILVPFCVYVILCPFHCWWAFEWCVSQGSLEEQTWQDECSLQGGFVTSAYIHWLGG